MINLTIGWKPLVISFEHEIKEIIEVIQRETSRGIVIYPHINQIMRPFYETPLCNVKVIIMGQEPYYCYRQANGLAFSVDKGISIPHTLSNIFKEISENIKEFTIPSHGDLSSWCSQGVLLINASLTVENYRKRSHEALWKGFIRKVIKLCSEKGDTIFVLWGKEAERFDKDIDTSKNLILKSPHPSPYSADKGFFGCNHFKMINEILKEDVINWNL